MYSLSPTLTSSYPYFENTTRSPSLTDTGMRFSPSSSHLPSPTATTTPCSGFSCLAESGMIIPAAETVPASSSVSHRTTTRSANGLIGHFSDILKFHNYTITFMPLPQLAPCAHYYTDVVWRVKIVALGPASKLDAKLTDSTLNNTHHYWEIVSWSLPLCFLFYSWAYSCFV